MLTLPQLIQESQKLAVLRRRGPVKTQARKLRDSANASGGRLGWRKGAHPEPGAAQSRAQDANLHDTRFGGP